MGIEEMKFGVQVLQFVLTGGLSIYVYLSNRSKVTNDRITDLEDDIDEKFSEQGQRIAKLEAMGEVAITHDDLARLHNRITVLGGEVKALNGEFVGVRSLLNTIHEFLLNGGKK